MDFKFIENSISKKWIVSSPRIAARPDIAKGSEPVCPFCYGNEEKEKETYRFGGKEGQADWQIRVIPNKYPFAPIHEIVIHSPDHHKNFDELPLSQNELILKTYRQRFLEHQDKGQVYIFHNHGEAGGESLPHPHSQIVVIPDFVKLDITPLSEPEDYQETPSFKIFCPKTSEWPDEIWIMPKNNGKSYAKITDEEIKDLAKSLYRLIQIFDLRHGNEFPYNFYISPSDEWYLRIVPRIKTLGGFEIGTNVSVNTQEPQKTLEFIKEHFESPDEEKIREEHRAKYHKAV
jgi:UDPglucose--hexose-1-phosphate uridylyltransferase